MEAANPFAHTPTTSEPIIEQVRCQLADEARDGAHLHPAPLDHLAEDVVRALWSSRVKTFIPTLALREARALLIDQHLMPPAPRRGSPAPAPPAAPHRAQERAGSHDALSVAGDMYMVDERDVIPL